MTAELLRQSQQPWSAGLQYSHFEPYDRIFEVGLQYEGTAYTFAFIDNKDVLGFDIKAQVFNLTNGRHIFRRTVHTGFRNSSSASFNEADDEAVGLIYTVSVKGKS
jgi:hypothetical protein